ncbi:MAG: hypothetical protein B7Y25_03075 [Alphaproteobacteria bacterium 16-39-46]|nr:MAG: hypothetical protein B7Y25_03075 [Alphaproteobacteria bacterium 16-39-46]OZA43396.1 MAG: hypothetical protein B7X84_03275 [Alphaproteobacteria bacterium 17-39-52]HQS83885.1 TauD/TfdA family dioxygenase [Alphaproteobacteria bacterium]HQS93726.1 TauD/TfdA family dioxygenase [Alphaproteobacteria bacterium]
MKVIINNKRGSILDIEKGYILENLKEYGSLNLKNFDVSVDTFSKFIGKIASRITNDPARKASTKNTQQIMAGDMAMGLHLENGNAPYVPDFQFFYCPIAPKKLSRTTYCDGEKAFRRLSKPTAKLLQNRKIMYTRFIDEALWKKYFSTEFNKQVTSLDEVRPFLPENTEIIDHDNGKIEWRVRRYAVYNDPMSKLKVQAHSILAPSINYDIPRVTWSDGSLINPSIIGEIIESCEKETHPIDLEDGDVAILNNHRVMHGREEILDPNRVLFGGQGYL